MTTLQNLIDQTSQSEVFGNIFDQATEDDLAFYFATYEVYGDNFIHFLQRKSKLIKPQYDKYLTIEATEFNPLITEYLKITHDNTITNEHENDTKHTGHDDIVFGHKNTASGSDQLTHGLTNTRTGSESHNDTGTITRTGSETNADTTYTEYQGSENTQVSGDSAALAANTPPTSPNNLSTFRSNGFESGVSSESMTDSNSNSTTSYTNRKDQHGGANTVTYNSVKDTHSGGDTLTYNNVTDTQGGTDTTTHGRTDTESGTNTNNFNSNVNDKGNDERKEDLLEEREGYNGISAELLGSARNYIINTNAFKWLVTELLTCFMDIMEY